MNYQTINECLYSLFKLVIIMFSKVELCFISCYCKLMLLITPVRIKTQMKKACVKAGISYLGLIILKLIFS